MRNRVYFYLIAVLLATFVATPCLAGGFDDVPADHWAYNAVQYLYNKGVLEGDEWGLFNGDQLMTRYEFAVAVARIVDLVEVEGEPSGNSGEAKGPAPDVKALVEELKAEFAGELDEIRATLEDHETRITGLEGDVSTVKDDMGKLGKKLENIDIGAYLRLRFEGIYKDDDTQVQRPRMTLKFTFDAPINDQIKFKSRLASGDSNGPTSTNQTFGEEFVKRDFWIDRAFFLWEPKNAPDWKFYGGKFNPNWVNTLVSIDSDVNVEGIGQSFKNEDGVVLNFAEIIPDEKGFYLVGQIGKENLFTKGLSVYAGYHFINEEAWKFIAAKLKDGKLKNNMKLDRVDMTDYQAVDLIGQYTWDAGGTPVVITGNFVRNMAGDASDEESGLQDAAWCSLDINKLKVPGDLAGSIEFGKLQANSVLSFLTDADRGSGNQEFWVAGFKYRAMEHFDIMLTYLHLDKLVGDGSSDIIQFDLVGTV